ncbi:helix-turn-helix domain-containing protein [Streptosporangium sp. CA-115845]|uniref:helix-turn-helix domain-containing protein n=1 Tax=Streptosporangium sp. CA-115845 TaxID=3240071 RepID=UPI003D94EA2F
MATNPLHTEDVRDPEDIRVGATIRALTEAHGWKVGELAAALKCSHSYVSNVMAGRKRANPKLCRQIADLLRIPLAAIISGDEYAKATSLAESEVSA